jgi:hypothetical protein
VTSYTHSAVDNLLEAVRRRGLPFLRLGSAHRVRPSLRPFTEDVLLSEANPSSVEELDQFYKSKVGSIGLLFSPISVEQSSVLACSSIIL